MRGERVRGHLKTLLLAAIATAEPTHGYGVIAAIERATGGVLSFNEGAVYPSLHQLEADRLVSSSWDDAGGRRRRVYVLTKRGHEQLRADAADWLQFRDSVDAVLKGVPWLAP